MEKQNSSPGNKVKLLCSYGGKIQPRPTDHQLSYVGGDTKILAVDRSANFTEIVAKLNSLISRNDNSEISVKYQFPGEDLDALVSLIDDDDVEHMMVEYDRMQRISAKPVRLRLFIFDIFGQTVPPVKSGVKDPGSGNPDYLFGFDKEYQPSIGPPLDLLQIPGMVLPQNYGLLPRDVAQVQSGITESHVTGRGNNVNVNGTAAQAVYRIPVVANGGVYQTGQYAYGVVTGMAGGNREQPVYNFVPIVPSFAEQRMIASAENDLERKVNQQIF